MPFAFGYFPAPDTEGFQNLSRADVDDAQRLAKEKEAAVDALQKEMSPAEIVRAYAHSDAAGRATMDLSALAFDQQDWLLKLSDNELTLLGMSMVSGFARSLEERKVLPIYKPKAEMETAEILVIPTEEDIEQEKRDFITARSQELIYAPGIPNPNRVFPATRCIEIPRP
jgi:hypothetical protein